MRQEGGNVRFIGEEIDHQGTPVSATGNLISDMEFNGGTISADIKFIAVDASSSCDIIFFYDNVRQQTFQAGISNEQLFGVRSWIGKWQHYGGGGDSKQLEADRSYHIVVGVKGSTVNLSIDGVEVHSAEIPIYLPRSQVGLFCMSKSDIEIQNFKVRNSKPKAFVVMQFSSPYDEVYSEVIRSVCEAEGLDVLRIDEEAGPGLIIADISRAIRESKIVIADISPANPNVFYEVGYAHALNKPTILLAERETKLPFDVSAFRAIFYDNSIAGKRKLEENLSKNVKASLLERRG